MADRPFIQFNKPDISELEERNVIKVLRSGWLGYGYVAQRFEEEFSKYVSNSNCIAVNSCTMGLILALRAENIGPGDKVLTTPLTFTATVNAIHAVGATPMFVDVRHSGSIDFEEIKTVIDPEVKAVIPVHLWGKPCDMNELQMFCKKRQVVLIEDAAHGFGGNFFETPLGTMGDYGVFSFYPTKNITTGDGGMVVCKDDAKADQIRIMASQGLSADAFMRYGISQIKDYRVISEGYKGLMNDLSASIGLAQLERWNEISEKRNAVWKIYEQAFGSKGVGHSQHLYTIQSPERDKLRSYLHTKSIGTGIHYKPLHLEPAFEYLGLREGSFPIAEKIGAETLSLPISSKMTEEEAHYVVETVREAIH